MKRLLVILLATALLGLVPAAQAEAKTFKNCNDLRKVYKYGISLSMTAANRGAGPIFAPKVSAAVFKLNTKLDLDADKIVCEVTRPKPSPTATAAPTPTPTPTPAVAFPVRGTSCSKIGVKVFGVGGYMKCVWGGGPTVDFLKNVFWRYYPEVKISTSQSNNYPTKPIEKASCQSSGDRFDVPGGIIECRWIAGKKLQWIKINTVKTTFSNAVSPVSIERCKLQNSASTADRTGRNAGSGLVGFPLTDTDRNRMNLKGVNEVLIVPIDFPDFQGGNEVLAAQFGFHSAYSTGRSRLCRGLSP